MDTTARADPEPAREASVDGAWSQTARSLRNVALFRRGRAASLRPPVGSDSLTFDEPATVQHQVCSVCGRRYPLVKALLRRDGDAYAVAFCALHAHDGVQEAWIDVILGSFGDDAADDHVTFGCRVGPVPGQDESAASAVHAAQPYGDGTLRGRKLSRDEALNHPRLPEFWEVVDFLLLAEPTVQRHIS